LSIVVFDTPARLATSPRSSPLSQASIARTFTSSGTARRFGLDVVGFAAFFF
jgi:hypothetical protein